MFKKVMPFILFVGLLSSCVAYKKVPYFVDVPATGNISEEIKNQFELKIQKDDVLSITVSSLNKEASEMFNRGDATSFQGGVGTSATAQFQNGFLVDQQGFLRMPILGSIKVEGLTTSKARELILQKLIESDQLKEPVVSLKISNFKFSVLGDVARPNMYSISNERINVLEALSLAGDLNITGKRDNILLIRENQGVRQQVRLDIQSKELLNSPYYYLQNNDVLYVQPGEAKYSSVDTGYRNLSLLMSVVSVVVLILTRL